MWERMRHDAPYANLTKINERCKIMLEYKIEGGNLPVVICSPESGHTLCTEKKSMPIVNVADAISSYITPLS